MGTARKHNYREPVCTLYSYKNNEIEGPPDDWGGTIGSRSNSRRAAKHDQNVPSVMGAMEQILS